MEEQLEVFFCDICNASVPQSDLEAAAARRVKGKIIGSCCLGDVDGESAEQDSSGSRPSTTALGAMMPIGVVLLVAVAGGTMFLDTRVTAEAAKVNERISSLEGMFTSQASRVADLDKRMEAGASSSDVEAVGRSIGDVRGWVTESETRVREGLGAAVERVQAVKQDLESLQRSQQGYGEKIAVLTREVRNMGDEVAAIKELGSGSSSGGSKKPTDDFRRPAVVVKPDPEAEVKALLGKLKDSDPGTRFDAVDKLVQLRNDAARPHLIEMLDDKDPFVRRLTAEGLRAYRHADSVGALVDVLADDESIVRHAAYSSLKKLTGQTIVFDPDGDTRSRSGGERRWKDWWRANQSKFKAGS